MAAKQQLRKIRLRIHKLRFSPMMIKNLKKYSVEIDNRVFRLTRVAMDAIKEAEDLL